MIFADVENIWTVDLKALSNADRGQVYFERAKQIIVDVLADPAAYEDAVKGAHFRRAYLVKKIGCQPAVTVQNPRIKKLLSNADSFLSKKAEQSERAARSSMQLRQELNVSTGGSPSRRVSKSIRAVDKEVTHAGRTASTSGADLAAGLIVLTDATCLVRGYSQSGIPALIWPEGIDEVASDWLRYVVVECGIASSSAREYAKIIRPFLRFCRARNRKWYTVDDEFLCTWREHLRRSPGVEVKRVNASMRTIFAFYRWAEETKRVRFMVGIYSEEELLSVEKSVVFPISAKRVFSKGKHGRVYGSWTTPLTIKGGDGESRLRHTPTEEEIRRLHEAVGEKMLGERDSLMLSWAEEAGPRRAEFLRLSKTHMPTSDELADLIERDAPWPILVQRKGGKTKTLNAPADLLIRTLDFIDFERREIVERCRSTIVGYREPDEIFLSSTTGMPLHPDSVTSIGRRVFREAGISNANIHRLRARFAIRVIETLVDATFDGSVTIGADSIWVETILFKAAEVLGQTDPRSLRPYLTYVLNRRIQTSDVSKVERLASRLRQMSLRETAIVRRLNHMQGLQKAAKLLQAEKKVEASLVLENILAQLV